jgi:hypothetical protein
MAGEGSAASVKLKRLRVAAAIGWTLLILLLCWLPKTVVHEVEDSSGWFHIPYFDKIVHGAIFFVFAVLWVRVGISGSRFAWAAVAALALAIVSELGQSMPFVNRDASFNDAAIDLVGAVVGLLMASPVEPWLRRVESLIWPEPRSERVAATRASSIEDSSVSPG